MHPLIPTPPRRPSSIELRESAQAVGFTTPAPTYEPPSPPLRLADRGGLMESHEKLRIRTAAYRAQRLYPGGIGEIVSRELMVYHELGLRLGHDGPVMRT